MKSKLNESVVRRTTKVLEDAERCGDEELLRSLRHDLYEVLSKAETITRRIGIQQGWIIPL
jgi:hypothetical protein